MVGYLHHDWPTGRSCSATYLVLRRNVFVHRLINFGMSYPCRYITLDWGVIYLQHTVPWRKLPRYLSAPTDYKGVSRQHIYLAYYHSSSLLFLPRLRYFRHSSPNSGCSFPLYPPTESRPYLINAMYILTFALEVFDPVYMWDNLLR